MSKKLEDFMLRTELRMQQLVDQIDTQKLVIAWLLNQLDQTEHFQKDVISKFLSRQANEFEGNPNLDECVAAIDELREDFALFVSLRDTPG